MKPCDICEKFQLRIDRQLAGGNNCASVFLCSMPSGEKAVLKYGNTEREKREVLLNITGYRKIDDGMGLGFFVPKLHGYSDDCSGPYILMEHCGSDFQSLLESGENSFSLTESLLHTLRRVFGKVFVGDDGAKSIDNLLQQIYTLVERFVFPHFSLGSENLEILRCLPELFRALPSRYTFASWDFTPNNLCQFLNVSSSVKFIDPRSEVTGNPIPGLACYAGILRDVHQFRNADSAYDMIHNFATSELSETLGISRELAEHCFILGRLFQSFMGVRFRVTRSRSDAQPFLIAAKKCLSQIV